MRKHSPSKISTMQANLQDMYIASLVSGTNAMVVCPPGYGKTEMTYGIAKSVLGGSQVENGLIYIELDPSSHPDVIGGYKDPAALINGQGVKWVYDGTPYDPKAKIVMLDELFRTNDVNFDKMIHTTNDIRRANRPVFWGTSNFVVKSPRTEALRDRFALWYHYSPEPVDIYSIVTGGDVLEWTYQVPSWDQIMEVRNMVPDQDTLEAISDQLELLVGNVGSNFTINPRRVKQWRDILYKYGAYTLGTSQFTKVPEQALRILKFAYPTNDEGEFAEWGQAVLSIVDALGTAMSALRAEAYKRWRQVVAASNPSDKSALHAELGKMLADAELQLSQFGQDEPAVQDALLEMNTWFRKAIRGEEF